MQAGMQPGLTSGDPATAAGLTIVIAVLALMAVRTVFRALGKQELQPDEERDGWRAGTGRVAMLPRAVHKEEVLDLTKIDFRDAAKHEEGEWREKWR